MARFSPPLSAVFGGLGGSWLAILDLTRRDIDDEFGELCGVAGSFRGLVMPLLWGRHPPIPSRGQDGKISN
jgi:hypothetical protein